MNPKDLMQNAINNVWPARSPQKSCDPLYSGPSILDQTILGGAKASERRDKPLFSARISVVRAANGYLLSIGTEDYIAATTYIARDLPEVMDLLRAAMAAVQLEDK